MAELDPRDYVHRTELTTLQSRLDESAKALATAQKRAEDLDKELADSKKLAGDHKKLAGDHETATKRLAELTEKVRTRSHRDAAEKVFDGLKVRKELRDDLYDLARIKPEADEPDEKALKARFDELLEKRPWAIAQEEDQPEPDKEKPSRSKLDADGDGGRGGSIKSGEGKFKVKRADIRNPDWMRKNQDKYHKAATEGTLVLVD